MHHTTDIEYMRHRDLQYAEQEYFERVLPFTLMMNGSEITTQMLTRAAADAYNKKHQNDHAKTMYVEKKMEGAL